MGITGLLLDIEHDGNEIKLYVKTSDGVKIVKDRYFPYFYAIPNGKENELMKKVKGKAKDIEKMEAVVDGDKKTVIKIAVEEPSKLSKVRDLIKEEFETREYDFSLTERYMIDKGITPMRVYEIKGEKDLKFKEIDKIIKIDALAFDIETYNPKGMPNPKEDPVIMVSYASKKEKGVLTWKKINADFVEYLENEEECLSKLEDISQRYDVIYTYNGDNFDIPYIKERRGKLRLGFEKENVKLRKSKQGHFAEIPGRPHVDVFRCVSFLEGIGAIRILRYTLEDVYKAVLGKEKIDVNTRELWKTWDNEKEDQMAELAMYSLQDSIATYELGEYVLPLFIELAKLTGKTLYHAVRISASHVVESVLIREAHKRKEIVPKKPNEEEVMRRIRQTIKGAYVKEPVPGLHENIAVLDFRSLYPSIIIAHNVDPFTLDKEKKCKDYYESPNGYRFCKDRIGLIPAVLKNLVTMRAKVKKEMKKYKRDSLEYKILNARQQSLKIAANATYGYLNFARARWYSKECAEAITAWGRYYVRKLIDEAEKAGFEVIYADTDSAFIKLGNKKKKDILDFLDKFNSKLPEFMELELEGFYKRGIFVTRKMGRGAAKKRYALLSETGEMKITGLEFVRTDWSEIAKEVQRDVLRLVLEGKVEEAKEKVRKTIDMIRKGEIPLEKYVIYTQLKQNIAQYEAIGPHVRAAKRLLEAGHAIFPGMLIGYIVTKGGGNIGDRSYPFYPVNLLGSRRPDPDYYINNQLLPAVTKILAEIGIKKDDLKFGGKQSKLGKWF